jgi:hypothetical protein
VKLRNYVRSVLVQLVLHLVDGVLGCFLHVAELVLDVARSLICLALADRFGSSMTKEQHMAKQDHLFHVLRARGVRKGVAKRVAGLHGNGRRAGAKDET